MAERKNYGVPGDPARDLKNRKLTYRPDGESEFNLGRYAPGFKSGIQGRWGRHPIPGQRGDLKEDLGDGSLQTTVRLQFVGPVANDYYFVVMMLTKHRRGVLYHPRRGARQSVVVSISEEVDWTTQGNESTFVDVVFEDAALNVASSFKAGPSANSAETDNWAVQAFNSAKVIKNRVFMMANVVARQFALTAEALVGKVTAAAQSYSGAALTAFSLAEYGPPLQNQLKALPAMVLEAQTALRRVGPAAVSQETIIFLENMLQAATQLDASIEAAQPIPIRRLVTRHPGQSIYAFVQANYGASSRTPAEMRALVGLLLRLNRQIVRPSLIPSGTWLVGPV